MRQIELCAVRVPLYPKPFRQLALNFAFFASQLHVRLEKSGRDVDLLMRATGTRTPPTDAVFGLLSHRLSARERSNVELAAGLLFGANWRRDESFSRVPPAKAVTGIPHLLRGLFANREPACLFAGVCMLSFIVILSTYGHNRVCYRVRGTYLYVLYVCIVFVCIVTGYIFDLCIALANAECL